MVVYKHRFAYNFQMFKIVHLNSSDNTNRGALDVKTGFFDLQNVAINRYQSLMHGLVYRYSPLCVVHI
jgi:hypothetical protein